MITSLDAVIISVQIFFPNIVRFGRKDARASEKLSWSNNYTSTFGFVIRSLNLNGSFHKVNRCNTLLLEQKLCI